MKAADTTLYWAKADGRNRYALFDADRHRRDVGRFALSARMPEALARGEFSLEYQPLVRLADRPLIGVEALRPLDAPERAAARPGPVRRRWPRTAGSSSRWAGGCSRRRAGRPRPGRPTTRRRGC